MMRIAILLLVALGAAGAEAPALAERVKAMKTGQRVDVDLTSGGRVTGHLSVVTDDGFELRETGTKRYVFMEVRDVREKMERRTKWTIGLLIYGLMAALSAAIGG